MNYISEADLEVLKKHLDTSIIIKKLMKHIDILRLIAGGDTAKEIGTKVFLSHRTVEHYIQVMCEIVGARSQAHLVAIAKDLKVI